MTCFTERSAYVAYPSSQMSVYMTIGPIVSYIISIFWPSSAFLFSLTLCFLSEYRVHPSTLLYFSTYLHYYYWTLNPPDYIYVRSSVSIMSLYYKCTCMYVFNVMKKVQVGKDQEKAQSEKDSHSINQGGKKQTNNQVLIP